MTEVDATLQRMLPPPLPWPLPLGLSPPRLSPPPSRAAATANQLGSPAAVVIGSVVTALSPAADDWTAYSSKYINTKTHKPAPEAWLADQPQAAAV